MEVSGIALYVQIFTHSPKRKNSFTTLGNWLYGAKKQLNTLLLIITTQMGILASRQHQKKTVFNTLNHISKYKVYIEV